MRKFYFLIAAMAFCHYAFSQCGTPPCNFIYVTTGGSASNPGTTACPTTLPQALALANSTQNIILVQSGSYTITSTLAIPAGVTIDGGYDGNWIKNSTLTYTTLNIDPPLANNGTVAYYIGIQPIAGANGFSLKDLTINVQTSGASGVFNNMGISIYGIYLSGQTGFSITRCTIRTGSGSAGSSGVYDGTTGGGLGGGAGAFTGYSPYNGMSVGSSCGGGNGCSVDPGCPGSPGTAGAALWGGGAAGGGGGDCQSGGCNIFGCNAGGCTGSAGGAGFGGNNAPAIGGTPSGTGGLSSLYIPVAGSVGYPGDGGGGGGGGGSGEGGTCCTCTCGNGWAFGGTGGNGGDGGAGGAGGYGGGGSFCIYAWGGSGNIIDCSLNPGGGGTGGTGADGNPGAGGAAGGSGENRGGCDGGLGGNGGSGGSGGTGGTGQQGATGISAGYEALNGAGLSGNFGSSNSVPTDGIVTANWYSGCTNSEIDLTKSTGDTWNLLNGSAFVNNLTSTSSGFNTGSSPAEIYYPSGTPFGSYNISLGSTTFTDFIKITGNRLVAPVNSIINSISNICPSASITLETSLSVGQQNNVIAYDWEIMNVTSPSIVVYSSTVASPGVVTINGGWTPGATYQVRLRLKEQCCGWSIPLWATFTVNAGPANAGPISGAPIACSSGLQTYSISPVSNTTGYTWTVSGGIITANHSTTYSANVTSITVNWGTSGGGSVSVQPYNACGNASLATSLTVIINGSPGVSIVTTPANGIICSGTLADLVANASSGSGGNGTFTYFWSTSSSNQQIEPSPISNTTYTVTVTEGVSGCTVTASQTITVDASATINAGTNETVCISVGPVTITGATASNYTSLSWSSSGTGTFVNDDSLDPGYTPSALDLSDGQVTLTLTAVAACGNVTSTKTLTLVQGPSANAGSNQSMCTTSSSITITGTGATHYGSLSWTTSGTGTFTGGTGLTPVYTPSPADISAGSVTVTLTATSVSTCPNIVSSKTISFYTPPTVNAGGNQTMCTSAGGVSLTGASGSNYSSLNWSTNGSGSFTNGSSLTASYTPSSADSTIGSVILTLTAYGNSPCGNVTSQKILTIKAGPTATAGANQSTCFNSGGVSITGANATHYTGLNWTTSGTGSFTGGTTLYPVYTPSAADIAAGSVTLTLTVTANIPCSSIVATKTLTITPAATANAGSNLHMCTSAFDIAITGASASNYNSLGWTTSGTGTFTGGASLTPTYTPSVADETAGSITLTLTSTATSPCPNHAVSTITLTFIAPPVVSAGSNQSMCSSQTNELITGASASHYDSLAWSSSGTGTFTNGTTLTASYVASIADINAGSVTLTLTAFGNSPCGNATASKALTFTAAATANAGINQSICANVGRVHISGATATNYSSLAWTTSGSGLFAGGTTLTPVYTASAGDISGGSVRLILTALGNPPCGNATDTITITFVPSPVANAGSNLSTCSNSPVTLNGSSASNYSDLSWSTSGTGSFINSNILHAVYTPGIADSIAGSVLLMLTASGNSPCDSATSSIVLTINPATADTISVTACNSYTSPSGIYVWTISGTYIDTIINTGGCDSIITINLTINYSTASSISDSICRGAFYLFNGVDLTSSGTFRDTLTGQNGCDSIVTLHLTVLSTLSSSFSATICTGKTYTYNGIVHSTGGQFNDTLTSVAGCDSIVTLNLTVLPALSSSFSAGVCPGGSYLFNGVPLSTGGTYTDTLITTSGCDSIVTLHLTINTILASSFSETICTGQSYLFGGIQRTANGAYLDTLTATGGCDSVVTLNLTVISQVTSSFNASICNGQSYLFGGIARTAGGAYMDTLTSHNGCDSIVTLNLMLLPNHSSSFSASICLGQTYTYNGIAHTTGGQFNDTLIGVNGCDSIVTLNLTVLPTRSSSFNAAICMGQTYTYHGIVHSTGGQFNDTLTAVNGCDSIVTLNLTVLPTRASSFSASICIGQSYLFNGIPRTSSGAFTDTLTAVNGCDSIVTLNLTVNSTLTSSFSASICSGQSYLFGGISRSANGAYNDTLTATGGCDSIVTLNLSVLSVLSSSFSESICNGGSYMFGGIARTTGGTFADTLTATGGCDSIVTLNLTVLPVFSTSFSANICTGQTYTYNGIAHSTGGQFNDTLNAVDGCDSIVTLNLTVLPTQSSSFSNSICEGQSYTYNGIAHTTGGQFNDTLTAVNGCDSIVTLNLTVLSVDSSSIARAICTGSSYNFNGQIISSAGVYKDTLTGVNGCDSVVTLNLSVNSFLTSSFDEGICEGASYTFGGNTYTAGGAYEDTLTASTGCDSIVTLNLSVTDVNDTVTLSGVVCTAVQTGATYQWMDCKTGLNINGATSQSYSATVNGSYRCVITVGNCTDTSACVQVISIGLPDITDYNISLYPNPTPGVFMIEHNYPGMVYVQIFNAIGDKLKQFNLSNREGHFDIRDLADGVYEVMVTDGKQLLKVIKVVKQ